MQTSSVPRPDLSVVIASVESARSIERCIESVQCALEGMRSELFVIDASRDGTADIAEKRLGRAHVTRCAPGTLTPELWAIGISRSTGRIIALTTGHFVVERTWAASLTAAVQGTRVGAAGLLELASDATTTDSAVFYLRYAGFIADGQPTHGDVPGIPADNAAYDGDSLRRFVAATGTGFWEVDFHRQIHAEGGRLATIRGATARYGRSFPFRTIVHHRFHHGRHAGAWRVSQRERSAPVMVAAAPLVPFVLAARAWRHIPRATTHRRRFVRALPVFLALASVWALGEAVGAVSGPPASRHPAPVAA